MRPSRPSAVALVAVFAGCSWGTVSPGEFAEEFGAQPVEGAKAMREVNVFEQAGWDDCVAKLRAAVGEPDAHGVLLTIFPTYAVLRARNPKSLDDVDDYTCRHGAVEAPSPVKLSESEEKELADQTFRFSEVDLARIPPLLPATVAALGLADGAVTSVYVRKLGPAGARELQISVNVNGTRKNGSIEYDGRGKELSRNQKKPDKDVFGADLGAALSGLAERLGPPPVVVDDLTLYATRILVTAESPRGSHQLQNFRWESGEVHTEGPSHDTFDAAKTFPLESLHSDVLGRLLADAHAHDGAVTHVSVDVRTGSTNGKAAPTIRLFTKDAGYPTYDLTGRLIKK